MSLAEKFFVIAFVVVLMFGLVMIPIRTRISRRLLAEWALDQKLELAEAQARFLRRGPFTGRASKSQTVFYLKVRDQEGNIRTGYARCGGFLSGLRSGQVDVRWVESEPGPCKKSGSSD